MTHQGTLYIYHRPKKDHEQYNTLHVIVNNYGPAPQALSHIYLPDEATARDLMGQTHDNNGGTDIRGGQYGHGDGVNAGRPDAPVITDKTFGIGSTYTPQIMRGNQWWQPQVKIEPGTWGRVGFRYQANIPFQVPAEGEYLEIPFENMLKAKGNATAFPVTPMASRPLPNYLEAMLVNVEPTKVEGRVEVIPVGDASGKLTHWEVKFFNTATTPPTARQTRGFTGIALLHGDKDDGNKNAGLGMESMPCPAGGYWAKQIIVAGGNYGVKAEPGANIRFAARAWGNRKGDKLPSLAEGPLVIDLSTFERAKNAKFDPEWFDGPLMITKLREKKSFVDFYQGDKHLNPELEDIVYEGVEAFGKAEYKDRPELTIDRRPSSAAFPGGGWEIDVKSLLPEKDKCGRVGMTVRLGVADGDRVLYDDAAIPPLQFSPESREHKWRIPEGLQIGGVAITPETKLVVDTGAVGWKASINVPAEGQLHVESDPENANSTWLFNASRYVRRECYPTGEGPQ
jgi:hypothetical protein